MKLLLIGPSRYKDDGSIVSRKKALFPRLTLLHLAGLTPEDVEVNIVEEFVDKVDFDADCDLVGITSITSQAPRAYTIADEFRKRGKKVVMGGIHVSSLPDEAKAHADSLVIGEAEYTWAGLIEDFKNNELKPFYKSEKLHDLKNLPIPRYDLVKKENYMAATRPVQTSRGCPHNCDFCTVTKFFGGSYRLRPIDDVIAEVKATKAKMIFFVDDNIIANRKYARELFTRLIPLKIKWFSQCTINLGLFPDLCKLATQSGCVTLCIGIESISQASLALVNKNHNKVEDYYKLLKTVSDNGISINISMIIGLDGDDENIFKDTLQFIKNVKPYRASLNVPIPLPGTKFADNLIAENRIVINDWSKYHEGSVVFTPKLMTREQLERNAYETVKKVYSYPSILSRTLAQPDNKLYTLISNIVTRSFIGKNEYSHTGG